MVLRKPYAFFIKMFKPIHIMIAAIIVYLIYLDSRILNFLNTYINSSVSVVGQNIKSGLINGFIYIIPALILILSMIILGVMFRKKKPVMFYIVNIFAYIVIIVINLYTDSFLGALENSIVSIKAVKLIHDLVLINILLESVSFVFFIVRGMGVDFKRFEFDSELSKFDISESDKEEFELNFNLDLGDSNRKRKERFRNLKYKYLENKFIINVIGISVISFVFIITIVTIIIQNSNYKTEGKVYSTSKISISVDETMLLNTDYAGEKITDDYLVVVNSNMKSNNSNSKVYLDDFVLNVGNAVFKPISKYNDNLLDLGNAYEESSISTDFVNYLFVYEIPEKYIKSDMTFSYTGEEEKLNIKLKPRSLSSNEISVSKNINEEISFEESLGDIKFKISDYEIKDKFIFTYDYCIKKDDCIPSKEYMKPSIDKNFDKVILRVNVDYSNNSDLSMNSFYKFFSRFGSIYYKNGENWNNQTGNFEQLKSSKVSENNNVYIGVRSDILNAESIKLVFNIRGSVYEYLLK